MLNIREFLKKLPLLDQAIIKFKWNQESMWRAVGYMDGKYTHPDEAVRSQILTKATSEYASQNPPSVPVGYKMLDKAAWELRITHPSWRDLFLLLPECRGAVIGQVLATRRGIAMTVASRILESPNDRDDREDAVNNAAVRMIRRFSKDKQLPRAHEFAYFQIVVKREAIRVKRKKLREPDPTDFDGPCEDKFDGPCRHEIEKSITEYRRSAHALIASIYKRAGRHIPVEMIGRLVYDYAISKVAEDNGISEGNVRAKTKRQVDEFEALVRSAELSCEEIDTIRVFTTQIGEYRAKRNRKNRKH